MITPTRAPTIAGHLYKAADLGTQLNERLGYDDGGKRTCHQPAADGSVGSPVSAHTSQRPNSALRNRDCELSNEYRKAKSEWEMSL